MISNEEFESRAKRLFLIDQILQFITPFMTYNTGKYIHEFKPGSIEEMKNNLLFLADLDKDDPFKEKTKS